MKLSLFPLSKSALTLNPLRDTIADDFDRDTGFTGGVTVANVGNQTAAEFELTGLTAAFPRQTFAKSPFFWHFMQMASLATHLDRECLVFLQKKTRYTFGWQSSWPEITDIFIS
jgi:hypothetical protein